MKWIRVKPKTIYKQSDNIIEKLAKIRGIDNLDTFLRPTENSLHDTYALKNVDIVRNKVLNAIYNDSKISIFWDLDSDGSCSGAIIHNYLKNFTDNIASFYSDKIKSHGISNAIDLIPKDTKLLIIVDSSTNDAEACKQISERGIDIVIIDHHLKSEDNPYAAILNPQLDDYPNKQLSGSALCWKVVSVLDDTLASDISDSLIDLAGVGLVSDVMGLNEAENRYIVHSALNNINNIGLQAIFKVAQKDLKNISTSDIGFSVAPLVNSAIRLGRMDLVIRLLTTDDFEEAHMLVKEINKLNNSRKRMQKKTIEALSENIDMNDKVIVVVDDGINVGIRGLIAGDIANKYQRPTIVLTHTHDGMLEGSCRSYGGFDFKSFLSGLDDCVAYAEGHTEAFGIGLLEEKLDVLKSEINNKIKNTNKERTLYYDLELDADDITMSLIEDVMKFNRITGKDMYEAKFKINNLMIMDRALIGKNSDTVKIECDTLDLLKFRVNEDYFNQLPGEYETIDVIASLNINKFYNFKAREWIVSNQAFFDDYKIS